MDLKSLSLFMQTSLVYECTVCKLYFGTENQLITHHKGLHSKRLNVSVNPELTLTNDADYNVHVEEEETPQDPTNSNNSISTKNGVETGESNVAKLQVNSGRSSSDESLGQNWDTNDASIDIKPLWRPLRCDQRQSSDDNQESSVSSYQCEDYEPALKRAKAEEPEKSAVKGTINSSGQELGGSTDESKDATAQHQHSQSMKDTIEQGYYGYLTETGFHRFSLVDLKKFAVQVVALFKLDESHHDLSNFNASSPIPNLNDVTVSSVPLSFTQQQPAPGNSKSASDNDNTSARAYNIFKGQPQGDGISGNSMDDPNKSCYKCGEQGHFAWGCTNPRNREIQPKRKRRGRKKGKQDKKAAN